MNKFNVCRDRCNLNYEQTEVDVTEIYLPRPLNKTLSKSWFAQKIAEAIREQIIPECRQETANSQPHLHYQVKHVVVVVTTNM